MSYISLSIHVGEWDNFGPIPYGNHGCISLNPSDNGAHTLFLHGTREEILAFADRIRAYVGADSYTGVRVTATDPANGTEFVSLPGKPDSIEEGRGPESIEERVRIPEVPE